MVGPIPAGWLLAAVLYGIAGAVMLLLAWVTLKPWIRPSPAWSPPPSVQLDWVRMLRPHRLATIGVALEHNQADSEILNRALGLAQPGQTDLVLLHVVDTPITQVYGAESADRETGADERYLDDAVRVLKSMGYSARAGPAPRPQPRRGARRAAPARAGGPPRGRLARPRHGPRPALRPDRGQGPPQPRHPDADRPPRPQPAVPHEAGVPRSRPRRSTSRSSSPACRAQSVITHRPEGLIDQGSTRDLE